MDVNEPLGGVDWPMKLSLSSVLAPQHSMVPSVFNAHVWNAPTLTIEKGPAEDLDRPDRFHPQHSTLPSVFNPHVCSAPALTEANEPTGGLDAPYRFHPQHSTEPTRRTPHV